MKKWLNFGHQSLFVSCERRNKRLEISLCPHFNIPLGKKRYLRIEGSINSFVFEENHPLSYYRGILKNDIEEATDDSDGL